MPSTLAEASADHAVQAGRGFYPARIGGLSHRRTGREELLRSTFIADPPFWLGKMG